jgi:RNA polymerase sigma-70 factor (ECF subfamily)|tara:strand:+ start:1062 stop:1607 length:546 start_codon:yes stop_codon:yes gene_type:complete
VSGREKRSFEILVRENTRILTVFLRSRVNDEAAVDDLFQETMLVAWKRLDDCDLSRPFGPWLRGIAHRLVMAHYRRQNRLPLALPDEVLELVDEHFENIQAQPGDTWDDKVAALHECLEALPENHRAVVQGRYLEDEPTKSVAERLGISLEACKKRLQRARAMLADCLKRKGALLAEAKQP